MTVDKFNEKIIFNEQQNFYINQFKNYKEIVSDVEKYSNIPDIVLTDIYRDLTRFKTQCSSILTLRDRTNTNFLIWHIKKKKIDRKLLGYQLSYFEGRFYKRENF